MSLKSDQLELGLSIVNLEILPYGLHFSEVMSFTKIIKDVDG